MNNKTFKTETTPVLRCCQSADDEALDQQKDPEGPPCGGRGRAGFGACRAQGGSGHLRLGRWAIESWVSWGALKETEERVAAGHCGKLSHLAYLRTRGALAGGTRPGQVLWSRLSGRWTQGVETRAELSSVPSV